MHITESFTFYTDDMVPDLLSNRCIWYKFYQVINCVDGGMNTFKSLDFLPNGKRIVKKRL